MMQFEGFQADHACDVARVSRAGFYRRYEEHEPRQADVELRDQIQRIALENRLYGSRRITGELRHRGVAVNRKRVQRLMRADNLLVVVKRRFVLTTESQHEYAIYSNLAARLNLTGVNQLWVADITYVRLREAFLYLAVVLDAWSRRVVGWELGRGSAGGVSAYGAGPRAGRPRYRAGHRSSLRPRCAVLLPRIRGKAAGARLRHQHEPHRQPL